MKKLFLFCIITLSMMLHTSCEQSTERKVAITPMPLELEINSGRFKLSDKTVFVAGNDELNKIAVFFAAKINLPTGYKIEVTNTKPSSGYINLELDETLDVNDEGYTLVSTKSGIDIKAKTAKGVFYGMQSVMQLLPPQIESSEKVSGVTWDIPAVTIKDEPRFQYRGHHLDVCRHFASIDFIKGQIDLLAMLKINIFHWHLTEDQAWRVEIKKYPKLTEAGAVRTEGDGSSYGPFFYTQDQIKEVVAYAAERFVDVIPELELPGHAVAAGAAYPHLLCTGKPIEVRNYWGVAADIFCAGNDEVFTFLEDIIDELVPLFPSKYFHIGGDEAIKDRWEVCPKCQARIKKEGITAQDGFTKEQMLQSYFVKRIHKVVEAHGKTMIGWDEITEGGLPDNAVVMSWTGEKPGLEMANKGYNVIMTPGEYMYLDKFQGESKVLPVTIGGTEAQGNMLTLAKLYSYNPIPEGLDKSKEHHILGVQANTWNEYKYTEADMQHDMWPRLIALAEVGWTVKERKDYSDFEQRLDDQRVRLDMHGVNYYIPRPERKGFPSSNKVAFVDSVTLEFETTEPVKMIYTLDGSTPNVSSKEYSKSYADDNIKFSLEMSSATGSGDVYKEPLTFTESTTLKIRSVLNSGKMGEVRTIKAVKEDYAPAVEKDANAKPGLLAEYYKGNLLTVEGLEGKKANVSEQVKNTRPSKYRINGYKEVYDDSFWTSVYTGYINIPEDGVYYFSTDCELWIDDKLVISNVQELDRARRFSNNDTSLALAKGSHKFKVVQLGATFGGWPTQWENVRVEIRKDADPEFKAIDDSYFE